LSNTPKLFNSDALIKALASTTTSYTLRNLSMAVALYITRSADNLKDDIIIT